MFFKEFNHFFRDTGPDDSSSGTSDFNEASNVSEPDDCYCESATNRSNTVYTKDKDIKKINDFPFKKVYFGSPNKMPSTMKLDGPLFVTPYIGLASIFAVRPQNMQKYGVPRGMDYNRDYDEWKLPFDKLKKPLKELHVRVEGKGIDIKPVTEDVSGYVYTIDITPEIKDHIYQSSKMDKEREFCIDKIDSVSFSNMEKVDIKMTVDSREPKHVQESYLTYEYLDEHFPEKVYLADVSLREADPLDIPLIVKMKIQTILDSEPGHEPSPEELAKITRYVENDIPKHLKDIKKIMYDNDRFIGILISYQKGADWFIDDIFLLPEYRHQGIGRMLLEDEIADHDQVALRVYKNNTHAIELYESLGFKVEGDMGATQLMRLRKNPTDLIEGYRVTYNGIGIYRALKELLFERYHSSIPWSEFINSPACSWLPKPPAYGDNDRSFFTKEGYDKFMELTLPVISKHIDQTKIYIEKEMIPKESIKYSDEYQFITSSDFVQESKMPAKKRNKLKNGDFGLVYKDANGKTIRNYPLNDKAHVASAARLFGHCPDKYKKRLANKILRKAHEYGMDTSGWDTVNKAAKG